MPKMIYEKLFNYPLSYTTLCLLLADQSLYYPMGIMEEICVRVDNLYVPADFTVVNTGTDERLPIILGWPFWNTARAIIYASNAKITLTLRETRKSFLSRTRHCQPLFRSRQLAVETRVMPRTRSRPRTMANRRPRRPRQHRWSLQSIWSMTTCSSLHIWSRRTI